MEHPAPSVLLPGNTLNDELLSETDEEDFDDTHDSSSTHSFEAQDNVDVRSRSDEDFSASPPEPKKRRKAQSADAKHKKRKFSAYLMFSNSIRDTVREEMFGDAGIVKESEVLKAVAAKWRSLPSNQKKVCFTNTVPFNPTSTDLERKSASGKRKK